MTKLFVEHIIFAREICICFTKDRNEIQQSQTRLNVDKYEYSAVWQWKWQIGDCLSVSVNILIIIIGISTIHVSINTSTDIYCIHHPQPVSACITSACFCSEHTTISWFNLTKFFLFELNSRYFAHRWTHPISYHTVLLQCIFWLNCHCRAFNGMMIKRMPWTEFHIFSFVSSNIEFLVRILFYAKMIFVLNNDSS